MEKLTNYIERLEFSHVEKKTYHYIFLVCQNTFDNDKNAIAHVKGCLRKKEESSTSHYTIEQALSLMTPKEEANQVKLQNSVPGPSLFSSE